MLTQAFQGFLGQTSVIQFGKTAYRPRVRNGGISGVVYYSTTRAEDDPELGGPEPWEPGIPGVTVNLYGPVRRGQRQLDELRDSTTTDNWDASCPPTARATTIRSMLSCGSRHDCFDGMRNWNQVRPGVFDGGYAFDDYCDS